MHLIDSEYTRIAQGSKVVIFMPPVPDNKVIPNEADLSK